ncbi:hypothetical protein [Microbispora sp. NBRC 16548]|uniref:hypothetical protein n=1 Tax=Microbispora sp. NBRC 16548 TaxID=3030994 RepID=UPI00255547DC|nr:hypothetical protein [Microbispora sp. NBRC 16548]
MMTPADQGSAPDAPEDSKQLRCQNPTCAELWDTDGQPRPLAAYSGTGRRPRYCSRRCNNAASNARKRQGEARLRELQGRFGALVSEHAPALQTLTDAVTAELRLLEQLQDVLLAEQAERERELADERAAAADAEQRAEAAERRMAEAERLAADAEKRARAAERRAATAQREQEEAEERAERAERRSFAAQETAARATADLVDERERREADRRQHTTDLERLRQQFDRDRDDARVRIAELERELALAQQRQATLEERSNALDHDLASLREELAAVRQRHDEQVADLTRQLEQARQDESEARDLIVVKNSALADADRQVEQAQAELAAARAAQRAAEQRAEAAERAYTDGVQGMLAELTRRLPVADDNLTPGTADAADGITDDQEKRP